MQGNFFGFCTRESEARIIRHQGLIQNTFELCPTNTAPNKKVLSGILDSKVRRAFLIFTHNIPHHRVGEFI